MNRLTLLALGIATQFSLGIPTLQAQDASRNRPATPVGAVAQPSPAAVGEKLQASWSGGWYDVTILEIGEGQYKVHYDGWGSSWDEWVAPSRLRRQDGSAVTPPPARTAPAPRTVPATATGARPSTPKSTGTQQPAPVTPPEPTTPANRPEPTSPPPAPAPKIWSASPVGRYVCRTWDYGQVNRVGEFVLQSGGKYRDLFNKGSGRYRYDKATNRIAFTSGPQKTNAKITFDPARHEGKGYLAFDYGGGARLDCYREALR